MIPALANRRFRSGVVFLFGFLTCLLAMELILASCNSSPSTKDIVVPAPATPSTQANDVLTYHNDIARTGLMPNENILTLANVNTASFGLLFNLAVDGKVDAQPLYVSNVNGHNLVIVVTEHGSVYGFDADSGAPVWHTSVIPSESPSDDHGCSQVTPEIGVTATPVIDRSAGLNGTIFLIAMSKDGSGNYFQRLHALDLSTGLDLAGSPKTVQATFPGSGDNSTGGTVIFDPGQYKERASLLLLNGVVYTAWSSHCDDRPYTGWIIGYDENTLAQTSVLNVTPNGNEGSFWGSGAGPAADSEGNIIALQANGTFDPSLNAQGFPAQRDYGNSFMKISTTNRQLAVADYFAPANVQNEDSTDLDLGSGGALVLPDLVDSQGHTRHLAVGAGKDAHIYVADRDNMGKFNSGGNQVYQDLNGSLGGQVFSMPAYFNSVIYYGAVGDSLKAFTVAQALVPALLRARARTSSPTRARHPASRPMGPATASFGPPKTPIRRCCTRTTPPTCHASFTTATRRLTAATTSAPATSSSRPPWRMARCMWGQPIAWACLACCIRRVGVEANRKKEAATRRPVLQPTKNQAFLRLASNDHCP